MRIAFLAAIIGLAGAGAAGAQSDAYERAFQSAFRANFAQRCVSSAETSAPGVKIDFAPICACAADRLLATKTVGELSQGLSDADKQAVVIQCVREHPPG